MRVCLIASSRHPVAEPFAGGLEAHTHQLAASLSRRGHEVTLFAAPGSDSELPVAMLPAASFTASAPARGDVNAPADAWMAEHHAYLDLMLELGRTGTTRFDVVHNNSLHYLPIAMSSTLDVPLLTTLHTPPTPWLESAIAAAPGAPVFVAVSRCTATAWSHLVESTTITNGVDTDLWAAGPGGGPAVWSGRLVPEKAPHEAIDAARLAGLPIVVAGPISDPAFFAEAVAPRLGPGARYVGHLDHRSLARLLSRAAVAVVTPAWDEPYGLVAAEAMACGTPVAAYARGAVPELVTQDGGALAVPGSVEDLAVAIERARSCDRAAVRAHAVAHHSVDRMVTRYEAIYTRILRERAAA